MHQYVLIFNCLLFAEIMSEQLRKLEKDFEALQQERNDLISLKGHLEQRAQELQDKVDQVGKTWLCEELDLIESDL